MTPPLTTINQPIYEMGRAAAHLLLGALGANPPAIGSVPDLRLVVRGTARQL
jgi:DNA-binding LacI/PurR family transcriptional regulator